ncbi:hypothetical protein EDB89DRAFT_1331255 [Lactarius sanguifluus]|nr:hypothetical protein EDB89DRAFT_1331255 [Lactarius sanguifluus]
MGYLSMSTISSPKTDKASSWCLPLTMPPVAAAHEWVQCLLYPNLAQVPSINNPVPNFKRAAFYKTTSGFWLNSRFVSARYLLVRTRSNLLDIMRLFRILPVLSLLFGTGRSSLQSREPAAHPLDARDLLDVCASVHTPLIALRLYISSLRILGQPGQFDVLSLLTDRVLILK